MKRIIFSAAFMILIFFSMSLLGYPSETIENVDAINSYKETVLVYFPKLPDMNFGSEQLELESSLTIESKIYTIIDKLIAGPISEELIDIMPTGTVLKKVRVKDNIAYLDFSKEFIDNHPGGSIGEYSTIYSVVNSVTELPEIDAVDFSVEGEKFLTYKGHCEFSAPIYKEELY